MGSDHSQFVSASGHESRTSVQSNYNLFIHCTIVCVCVCVDKNIQNCHINPTL